MSVVKPAKMYVSPPEIKALFNNPGVVDALLGACGAIERHDVDDLIELTYFISRSLSISIAQYELFNTAPVKAYKANFETILRELQRYKGGASSAARGEDSRTGANRYGHIKGGELFAAFTMEEMPGLNEISYPLRACLFLAANHSLENIDPDELVTSANRLRLSVEKVDPKLRPRNTNVLSPEDNERLKHEFEAAETFAKLNYSIQDLIAQIEKEEEGIESDKDQKKYKENFRYLLIHLSNVLGLVDPELSGNGKSFNVLRCIEGPDEIDIQISEYIKNESTIEHVESVGILLANEIEPEDGQFMLNVELSFEDDIDDIDAQINAIESRGSRWLQNSLANLKSSTKLFNEIEREWLAEYIYELYEGNIEDKCNGLALGLSVCIGVDPAAIGCLKIGEEGIITPDGYYRRTIPSIKMAATPDTGMEERYYKQTNQLKLTLPRIVRAGLKAIPEIAEEKELNSIQSLLEISSDKNKENIKKALYELRNQGCSSDRFIYGKFQSQLKNYVLSETENIALGYAYFGSENDMPPMSMFYQALDKEGVEAIYGRMAKEYFLESK